MSMFFLWCCGFDCGSGTRRRDAVGADLAIAGHADAAILDDAGLLIDPNNFELTAGAIPVRAASGRAPGCRVISDFSQVRRAEHRAATS